MPFTPRWPEENANEGAPNDKNAREGGRILGSLRSADGKGIVRMEDRFDTDVDDLWSALTEPRGSPAGSARWRAIYGSAVRSGRTSLPAERRARAVWRRASPAAVAAGPSRRRLDPGQPYELEIEATLTADGDRPCWSSRNGACPWNCSHGYGAGIQIHFETSRRRHRGRRARAGDESAIEARWNELAPAYQELAADIG